MKNRLEWFSEHRVYWAHYTHTHTRASLWCVCAVCRSRSLRNVLFRPVQWNNSNPHSHADIIGSMSIMALGTCASPLLEHVVCNIEPMLISGWVVTDHFDSNPYALATFRRVGLCAFLPDCLRKVMAHAQLNTKKPANWVCYTRNAQ